MNGIKHSVRFGVGCVALLGLGSPSGSFGQPPADPADSGALFDLAKVQPEVLQEGADPLQPTISSVDGIPIVVLPPAAIPEGTFVPPRTATLVRGARGGWYAVFHPEPGGTALPAMGLLPNRALERVEAIARSSGTRATARVSGQVYAYRSRNYLLLATVAPAPSLSAPPAAPPSGVMPSLIPPPSPGADTADPTVEELIGELQSPRREPRAIEPALSQPSTFVPGPTEAPEPSGAIHGPETAIAPGGTNYIVRRRVRVVRVGGAWAAVFDGDAGPPTPDGPMFLAPCQATERLEPRAAARGDSLVYEMTGRVTTYNGNHWILPTLVRPFRLPDVFPMQ